VRELAVVYSTWIDDLAFSGDRARDVIQLAVETLAAHGLRVKRKKIKIMGPKRHQVADRNAARYKWGPCAEGQTISCPIRYSQTGKWIGKSN